MKCHEASIGTTLGSLGKCYCKTVFLWEGAICGDGALALMAAREAF